MAEQIIIDATARPEVGKAAARATRRAGQVPCIIYGGGKTPRPISLDPRIVIKELEQGRFLNTIYEVAIPGVGKERALPRDVQLHPVTDRPLHVDFLRLSGSSLINVMIPVNFTHEEDCPGLERGGILSVVRHEVELICPADKIPDEVTCDLSGYDIGDTIHISQVAVPDGITPAITDRDFVVATVAGGQLQEVSDEAEEDVFPDDEDADDADTAEKGGDKG